MGRLAAISMLPCRQACCKRGNLSDQTPQGPGHERGAAVDASRLGARFYYYGVTSRVGRQRLQVDRRPGDVICSETSARTRYDKPWAPLVGELRPAHIVATTAGLVVGGSQRKKTWPIPGKRVSLAKAGQNYL
jgi:hypothetical protein